MDDLSAIAQIGSEAFSGLRPLERGRKWVGACHAAFPRTEYWVAVLDGSVIGYILWIEKGGFRDSAVIELEQIAVIGNLRGNGIGEKLVKISLRGIEERLAARGSSIKVVEVTTGSEQHAVEFYRRTLGAEVAATIPDYFRGDEFVLLARRKK